MGKGDNRTFFKPSKVHYNYPTIVICSFALDLQDCNDALFSLSMMDLLWHQLYHLAKTGVNAQIN